MRSPFCLIPCYVRCFPSYTWCWSQEERTLLWRGWSIPYREIWTHLLQESIVDRRQYYPPCTDCKELVSKGVPGMCASLILCSGYEYISQSGDFKVHFYDENNILINWSFLSTEKNTISSSSPVAVHVSESVLSPGKSHMSQEWVYKRPSLQHHYFS